ncbi:hypothetical protein BG011_001062 [Mortierella polycephala]|uniref:Crinkler effector protein N-terminal domain-containing protein n=1 Tax=Mortierella polycephala TaxID=41804 RepID=A0A9P6PLP6_9FUNG|nr:hypothetical protein BG011_001062 [Mortierella polycephala]
MAELNLSCLVDGEPMSKVFPLPSATTDTFGNLKDPIKAKDAQEFKNVDTKDPMFLQVSVPITEGDEIPIVLDSLVEKKRFGPATELSKVLGGGALKKKANILAQHPAPSEILDLKFTGDDNWRSDQTIKNWILQGPQSEENKQSQLQQLADYVASPEIVELKENEVAACLVVVVGSRQILYWEMSDGESRKELQLAA